MTRGERGMSATIVVPLSGPREKEPRIAEHAIPYAKALARRLGAPLTLVSVVDVPVELSAYYAFSGEEPETESGPAAERREYLNRLAAGFEGISVETVVRFGDPAD